MTWRKPRIAVKELGCSIADRSPPPSAWPRIAALAMLAALDFLAPGILNELSVAANEQVYLTVVVLGVLVGQPLLLAVWAVLGPSPFWRRWLGSLAAACGLY